MGDFTVTVVYPVLSVNILLSSSGATTGDLVEADTILFRELPPF